MYIYILYIFGPFSLSRNGYGPYAPKVGLGIGVVVAVVEIRGGRLSDDHTWSSLRQPPRGGASSSFHPPPRPPPPTTHHHHHHISIYISLAPRPRPRSRPRPRPRHPPRPHPDSRPSTCKKICFNVLKCVLSDAKKHVFKCKQYVCLNAKTCV